MTLMGGNQSSLSTPKCSTTAHREFIKVTRRCERVAWDVRECKTYELDRKSFKHGVMFFTDKLGIFTGFLDDIMNVLAETLVSAV